MEVVIVDSSAVLKAGHDGENLFVQFVGGDWYKYFNVPKTVFEELQRADSVGQFVNREVKPQYKHFERCQFNPEL